MAATSRTSQASTANLDTDVPNPPACWHQDVAQEQHGRCDVDAVEYTQLLEDLETDLDTARWKQAATHLHGEDLCTGVDVWQIGREQKRYADNAEWHDWALNIAIATGGQWPRVRHIQA
eukprot:7002272-Pyramimonas_sp.AAC.1